MAAFKGLKSFFFSGFLSSSNGWTVFHDWRYWDIRREARLMFSSDTSLFTWNYSKNYWNNYFVIYTQIFLQSLLLISKDYISHSHNDTYCFRPPSSTAWLAGVNHKISFFSFEKRISTFSITIFHVVVSIQVLQCFLGYVDSPFNTYNNTKKDIILL